ncbi:Probable sugar phosphate/phosphate translocator At3g17430 [Durusdinium trenchii]|uniref:Probable sugar phosphate/phosphate translocator At3g17430 n=1 Tax=Durusdinium trenchii TaxID=1381693 RepID=A0ABP0MFG0_9DINO
MLGPLGKSLFNMPASHAQTTLLPDHSAGTLGSAGAAYMSVNSGLVTLRKEVLMYATGNAWFFNVVPVALCQAATLALGNAAYLHFGVGMVQMLKAGTPIFVLLTVAMLRLESPSFLRTFFVALITVGTFITAGTTPEWSAPGLVLSLGAMLTEALRVSLTQFLLSSCKLSVTEGQYVLAPTASFALLLASVAIEGQSVLSLEALSKVIEYPHLFLFAAGLGTVVNYSSYLVIKFCGALSLKVMTTLRNIALVLHPGSLCSFVLCPCFVEGYTLALAGGLARAQSPIAEGILIFIYIYIYMCVCVFVVYTVVCAGS